MNNLVTILLGLTFIFLVNTQVAVAVTAPRRIVAVSPVFVVTPAPVVRTMSYAVPVSVSPVSSIPIPQPVVNTVSRVGPSVQIPQNYNYYQMSSTPTVVNPLVSLNNQKVACAGKSNTNNRNYVNQIKLQSSTVTHSYPYYRSQVTPSNTLPNTLSNTYSNTYSNNLQNTLQNTLPNTLSNTYPNTYSKTLPSNIFFKNPVDIKQVDNQLVKIKQQTQKINETINNYRYYSPNINTTFHRNYANYIPNTSNIAINPDPIIITNNNPKVQQFQNPLSPFTNTQQPRFIPNYPYSNNKTQNSQPISIQPTQPTKSANPEVYVKSIQNSKETAINQVQSSNQIIQQTNTIQI